MSRRLAIVLLLEVVSSSGGATCPRGVMACSMAQPAAHDCCKHRTTLRSDDCCCKAVRQLTAQAISTTAQYENGSVKPVAALLHAVLSPTDAAGALKTAQPLRHGPAPPDTPITQHTLLLL